MRRHGEGDGLPHALIEIRQDLIDTRRRGRGLGGASRRRCWPRSRRSASSNASRTPVTEAGFTLGIEEEYLLVDRAPASSPAIRRGDAGGMPSAARGQVGPEFLRAQIESAPRSAAALPRRGPSSHGCGGASPRSRPSHGLAPIAAGDPSLRRLARPEDDRPRALHGLGTRPQGPARRLVICGMHVHVGLEDPELRIDLMGQVAYFLPHLLALSTSSPFWQRRGHRAANPIASASSTRCPAPACPTVRELGRVSRHLGMLIRRRLIEDGTKLWWDIRPPSASRRWRCGSPTSAPGSTTASRSLPSTAASCACSGA